MNRSVEQALNSLIPRLNSPLPPELVDLASSLLAQSRNKASNLKAEEEIGRTYACANIACERLKATLNLPKIEPRPPCPPRIYKKLYTYLSTILQSQKRSRAAASTSNTLAKVPPSRPTPTKERSLAQFKPSTSSSRAPTRGKRTGLQYEVPKDVSPWIPIVIRRLCKELSAPAAIPSVLAGVSSMLTLPSPIPTERTQEGNLDDYKTPGLIAAVYFLVKTRLLGKEMDGKSYSAEKRGVLSILEKARVDPEITETLAARSKANGRGESLWPDWENIKSRHVDLWLQEISSKGWTELDWFKNVVQGAGLGGEEEDEEMADEDVEDGEGDQEGGKQVKKDVLQAGLGTMMQDRVDYLSERKREEYKIWKEGIQARIKELTNKANEMDTTE